MISDSAEKQRRHKLDPKNFTAFSAYVNRTAFRFIMYTWHLLEQNMLWPYWWYSVFFLPHQISQVRVRWLEWKSVQIKIKHCGHWDVKWNYWTNKTINCENANIFIFLGQHGIIRSCPEAILKNFYWVERWELEAFGSYSNYWQTFISKLSCSYLVIHISVKL